MIERFYGVAENIEAQSRERYSRNNYVMLDEKLHDKHIILLKDQKKNILCN